MQGHTHTFVIIVFAFSVPHIPAHKKSSLAEKRPMSPNIPKGDNRKSIIHVFSNETEHCT